MCTFNGAAYLPAQWQSLVDQVQLPDEVVVFDDASTDGTWDLLQRLADEAPFLVRLHRNPVNVGFLANFEQSIATCTGDLIALCDQDDIWHCEKLAAAQAVFAARPAVMAFFSDAVLVDALGRDTNLRAWECVRFSGAQIDKVNRGAGRTRLVNAYTVTGATLVLRATLREVVLPFPPALFAPNSWHAHDGWIAALAASVGEIHAERRALVNYRTHSAQALGLQDPADTEALLERRDRQAQLALEISKLVPLRDRLLSCAGQSRQAATAGRQLQARVRHLQARLDVRSGGRRRHLVLSGEILRGSYRRHSKGLRSAALDLIGR